MAQPGSSASLKPPGVVSVLTGTGYGTHVQTAVVDRLGLTDTGPEWDPARAGEYAAGHTGLLDGDDVRQTIAVRAALLNLLILKGEPRG